MPPLKPSLPQNKALRVWIGLGVIVALALASLLLFWLATRGLFSKNPRFTLQSIEVRSPGWWKDKERNVATILRVKPGETNLFALKLENLRKTLEAEPSIESASVTRILPDTLIIDITERIPRAFLFSPRSPWVVDGNGVIMSRDTCVNLDGGLPVILGFQSAESPRAGLLLKEVKPGLDLINMTLTDYRSISIAAINLVRFDQCVFVMYYKGNFDDAFKVFMPRKNLKLMFRALVSSLEEIRGETRYAQGNSPAL